MGDVVDCLIVDSRSGVKAFDSNAETDFSRLLRACSSGVVDGEWDVCRGRVRDVT